jgi:thiol:disulfide interchange protein
VCPGRLHFPAAYTADSSELIVPLNTAQLRYTSTERQGLYFRVMPRLHSIFAILLLAVASLPAFAQSDSADAPHVHVRLMVLPQALNRGESADAGLYFKIDAGWHIYWKNAGDAGEPPQLHWTLPNGITAGDLQFPAPKRLPLGPLMDFGYEDEVLFPFKLNVSPAAKPGPAQLDAKVSWLVCRATCIPGKAELVVNRDVSPHPGKPVLKASDTAVFNHFVARLPKSMPTGFKARFQPSKDGFRLGVVTGQREASAEFFPSDQNIIDNPAPQKFASTATGFVLDLKKDANLTANPAELRGVLELSRGRAFEISALPGKVSASESAPTAPALPDAAASTPGSFGAAGTETVQPSPAAAPQSSFLKLMKISGLAFLGGLLLNLMPCVFPVLFLKGLALVNSGNEERQKLRAHGFVYAAGILVSFWALVAALLALRGAGARLGWGFQFQSPVFLELMAGLLFFLGLSLAGQFDIGLTLTGTGSSLAAKQGYTGSFFTGVLAVVVATPCTAPFMGAAVGYALAQSVAVTFTVFTALALGLATPYVALTLQPAWTRLLPRPGVWMDVLKQAISVPIFATVIWLAWVVAQTYGSSLLVALLVSFLLMAIAGWFLGRWPARRWASLVTALIVLGVIAFGIWAPGKLAVAPETSNGPETQAAWEPWSAEAVARYQAQGRPVFVDFTAKWCLSCQVNERVALSQPEVQKAFAEAHVALLRADWTQRDEAIAQALAALDRSGVPAYALYAPGQGSPQMLPEVLTPGIVTDAVRKVAAGR